MSDEAKRRIYEVTTRLRRELDELSADVEEADDQDLGEAFEEAVESLGALRALAAHEQTVKAAMRRMAAEERFGINETELAEMVAEQLDLQDALDNPDHPIWDWAVDVLEEEDGDEDDDEEEDEQED
jgi:hypothetical protein